SIAASRQQQSSLLPPQPNHPPVQAQSLHQHVNGGSDTSSGIAPPRFARSLSTPTAARGSNQVAAAHDERPQLTIQVPSPLPHGIVGSSLGSHSSRSEGEASVSYQSLLPLSPSTHNDNIRVLLRIRPPTSDKGPHHEQLLSRRCLDVAPDAKGVTLAPSTLQEKRFGFDQVFTETSSQEQIFMDIGVTAVENTINGFNGCIFAYGQTGSGKTFTMLGGTGSGDTQELRMSPLRGLTPRIFDHLFVRLSQVAMEKGDALEYSLSCSYLEIYNEKIFDLLEESANLQPKSLREDAKKEVYVEQLRDVTIQTESEAIEWLQFGSRNRRMASTDMNRESSRSHAVFTIKLVQTERMGSGVMFTRRSNLHLVDLAGSEKQQQTKAAGQRLKEAAQINKSLSALGNVIMSLVDVSNGQKRHVHYRDSKLTFLLKDSLGGNAITTIVATISGEEKYFSETLSTLKFAQRAKYIKNKAVQNQDSDSMVPLLKQEIERLREEIAQLKMDPSSSIGSPTDTLKSSPTYHHHQEQPQAPVQEPKKNRWEPALDVMDKLLRASGAAAPADLEEYEECNPVEVRCERLEMLLYRMICRYEEHKEIAFSSDRLRHKSSFFRPAVPMKSFIRAPKKYGVKQQSMENQQNQQEGRFISPEEEKEILEEIARGNELERENNLIRQELIITKTFSSC
uniref:Kinesin motor domain-containing protein n=1 Tax=Globisporangium ultimum (strain ATCC 200006 / CBS 805.95 / DAOM BR144) TaxID=431595 RepID=K3X6J9_GLOUD